MAYATASTGFKAGGFGLAGNAVIPYDPEHLTAYELGIRIASSLTHFNSISKASTGITEITRKRC